MPRRTFVAHWWFSVVSVVVRSRKGRRGPGHQVVVGGLQRVPDGPAVELVLLHQQVLRAGGLGGRDDGREVQVAFAHFSELDHVLELGHEAREVPGFQQPEGGLRQLADPVVLQVDHGGAAGVLFQGPDRVQAAALHPVDVDFHAHGRGVLGDDVQHVLAVELRELDVVVVVVQAEALLLQPLRVLVGLLGEVNDCLDRLHGREGQHADPQELGVQALGVLHDLVEVVRQRIAGHALGGLHRDGQRRDVHAQFAAGAVQFGHVLRRHRDLGDLDGVVADRADLAERFERPEFG